MARTIPIVPANAQGDARVYARSVKGWFAGWRWALVAFTQALFYGLPWLTWNGRQAVLFDLDARRFHILGFTFTPQDFILLTLLLAVCALSLFLFTAIAGRLWCGYACPQTVYSELFQWIERRTEGDRAARLRRDRGPRNADWWARKLAKHGLWLMLAAWTGFTFVGYFVPIRTLGGELIAGTLAAGATFWIGFYALATYGNAGWLREKVCKYMCPYARFQGVMFDRDTLTVTYDVARGEPRGARRHSVKPALGQGACVDCTLCVQVCPTGIDIRQGLQYACIGCAACIDACNGMMDRVGQARGLIRYGTESGLSLRDTPRAWLARLWRVRVLCYAAVLGVLLALLATGLSTRTPLKADVLRDRAVLSRVLDDGGIENLYRLHLTHAGEAPLNLRIAVDGLAGITLPADEGHARIGAQANATLILHARLPADADVPAGTHPITFRITEERHDGLAIDAASSFVIR
ncbi:cytochrome c oxidase accessory protein CcoG [Achromobacter sp. GG226]|uniref:cytochrome c oxidase accessory protein CcoG n=1 Tax=Verticiella alkaliphila TaxID=2779529 RepID=UPI001C0D5427|nr:cytochrome c oxidase accessory protein CcoG [Verticiella sp. GG226]MBU4609297.1 cytochrome c oxidase accessory protein CcoG [Verticiella sp. GG226]